MDNKPIWAPWRVEYILGEKPDGCPLCDMIAANNDERHNILFRGATCYVILNLYPYNNGHLMITPYRHTSDYTDLTQQEMAEIGSLTSKCISALKDIMAPQGFNIGMNLGKSAGAGIEEHLHMHVIPRWNGDNNFMPAIGQTKVIPQHLKVTFDMLKPKFA